MCSTFRTAIISITALAALLMLDATLAYADSAAEQEQQGRAAFNASQFPEALAHYRRAYGLDSTPMRALQVAIVSPYAQKPSAALADLWRWLQVERNRAPAAGAQEPSWHDIGTMQRAFVANIERLEAEIISTHTSVERLNERVKALQDQLDVGNAALAQARSERDTLRGSLDRVDRSAAKK